MNPNVAFAEQCQIVPAFPPGTDINTDADGDWVSMANFHRCTIVFHKAAGTAGDDPSIALNQATSATGTSSKALNFSKLWYKIGATALSAIGTFTRVDLTTATGDLDLVSVNSVDLLSDVGESLFCVDIKGEDLDVDNGFKFLQLFIEGDDVGNATLAAAYYILWAPRQAVPVSAIA